MLVFLAPMKARRGPIGLGDPPAGSELRTLGEIPDRAARLVPDRVGLITLAARYTFSALASAIHSAGHGLVSFGLQPRERCSILLPNSVEYVHAFYAIPKAGGVVVPVSTFLAPAEVATILDDAKARCLITTRRRLASLGPYLARLGHLDRVILAEGEEGADARLPARVRLRSWAEVAGGEPAAALPAPARPEEPAVLTYTSGTTGRMKGVILTHANLMANARSCLAAVGLRDGDRLLLFLPMFHSLTQLVCLILPPLAGLAVVLLPGVDRAAITAAIRKHRPTIFLAVPSIYAAMAERPPGAVLRWLNPVRLYLSGGAPLSPEVMRRFERGWGRPICEGYGLSEAAPVVSLHPVDGERRPGSVGLPVPGVEVRITREDGTEADPDEIGEILVRGPNVMAGYHEKPEETAAVLRDGWLHTGDLGRKAKDGYIYIMGRRKELLLYRGMNVYPREVEEALASHPGVAEAAVVGLSDAKRGDVPHAAVSLRNGVSVSERELREFCRQKLARYKVPRTILVLPSLPRNPTGKVMKDAVREAILAGRAGGRATLREDGSPQGD